MRLVIKGSAVPPRTDAALLKMVAQAHCWFEDLASGQARSAQGIARKLGVTPRYVQRLLPLALLAPERVEQIVAGGHEAKLTAQVLAGQDEMPMRWRDQG